MAMMASPGRKTMAAAPSRAERALRFFHWLWPRSVPGVAGAVEISGSGSGVSGGFAAVGGGGSWGAEEQMRGGEGRDEAEGGLTVEPLA